MKLIYLYTNLNWYRIELFRSISKLLDCHVYILNGYEVGYQGIEYNPEYQDLIIDFLSPTQSQFNNLVSILDEEDFDAIVVPSMNDGFYLKLTTRLSHYYNKIGKTVLYFWEYWPMEKGSYSFSKWAKQEIRHLFTRINRNSISYFITPSINTYSFYQRMNIPSRKLIRCPNVSRVTLQATPRQGGGIRSELKIKDNEKVILYFGRVEDYKGIHELIVAFKKLERNDCHLLICGPGEEKIDEEIRGQGSIHVTGGVRPELRTQYYQAADLFVLPNTYRGKIEPWGLTVNEAMQFGIPIICSNATGSAVDLVFPGVNGYVVNADNLVDDLEFYMKKILSDDKLAEEMGHNSMQIISEYTFDHMAQAFYVAVEKGRK